MTTTLASEQVNGNKFVALQAGLSAATVTSATQLSIGTIVAVYVAPFAGQLTALTGVVFLTSGSASATVKLQAYKNGTAVSTVVTSAITPTTGPQNLSYTTSGTPVSFAVGDQLSIYAVTSGSISNLSANAALKVSTF